MRHIKHIIFICGVMLSAAITAGGISFVNATNEAIDISLSGPTAANVSVRGMGEGHLLSLPDGAYQITLKVVPQGAAGKALEMVKGSLDWARERAGYPSGRIAVIPRFVQEALTLSDTAQVEASVSKDVFYTVLIAEDFYKNVMAFRIKVKKTDRRKMTQEAAEVMRDVQKTIEVEERVRRLKLPTLPE